MALVFQYGSNTSSRRLNDTERLRGDAMDLGPVCTTEVFELEFDVWSDTNNCAAADIREGAGRQIWGVLYDVPDYLIDRATSGDRKSLDAIEGRRYQRRSIKVARPDGTPIPDDVITYTVSEPQSGLQTSLAYASHILCGLRQHNAPAEYVAYVKRCIVSNNSALEPDVDSL